MDLIKFGFARFCQNKIPKQMTYHGEVLWRSCLIQSTQLNWHHFQQNLDFIETYRLKYVFEIYKRRLYNLPFIVTVMVSKWNKYGFKVDSNHNTIIPDWNICINMFIWKSYLSRAKIVISNTKTNDIMQVQNLKTITRSDMLYNPYPLSGKRDLKCGPLAHQPHDPVCQASLCRCPGSDIVPIWMFAWWHNST